MPDKSNLSRIESFSDGVFVIALTLLVIDLKEPPQQDHHSVGEVWFSLKNPGPAFFAFLLSFGIILISWVNHHSVLLLVDKTSPKFVYANGLLLLTIVFMPFPTAFLAEYIWTDLAAPAVVLYSLVNLMQSVAWTVMMRSAVYPVPLCKNEHSKNVLKETYRISFYAILVYGACTVLAFWFPKAIAMIITFIWIMWLFWGLHFKQGQPRKINLKM